MAESCEQNDKHSSFIRVWTMVLRSERLQASQGGFRSVKSASELVFPFISDTFC
jgi:hypothetical protein